MTPRNLLVRGLLAGLVAGLLAFAVAYLAGEPHVDAAIALEEGQAATTPPADGHTHEPADEPAQVSRAHQSTWGLLTGTLAVGLALGGVTGLAAAFALGRLGRLGAGESTALVTLVGFVAFSLVPWLKYPATPPAVGDPDTIGARTVGFFALQAISVLAAVAAVLLARRLATTLGAYRAVVLTATGYLLVVVLASVLLPTVNEVGSFPADTLWDFRRASLLTLATLWATIGVVLVGLVGRLHRQHTQAVARRELAAGL